MGLEKVTKTEGSTRNVDLSDGLVSLLAGYAEYVKAEAVAASAPEPYWLFPGRDGGLVREADERWHRKLFKHALHAAQLPEFHPKDLRHTFASMLLSQNVPLVYVSKQLGHSKRGPRKFGQCAKW